MGQQKAVSQNRFALLAVLYGAAFVLAALYPYNWTLPQWHTNGATRFENGSVTFPNVGIAWTTAPPSWMSEAKRGNRLEVELTVTPYSIHQDGPARILTISKDTLYQDLMIGQDNTDLVVRLRTPNTSLSGLPPHTVSNFFAARQSRGLHVSIEPGRLEIATPETKLLAAELPTDCLSVWDERYRLALGNEFTWDRPWLGIVETAVVQVADSRVDYLAPGCITIPSGHWTGPALEWLPKGIADPIINFLVFIPFGYLVAHSDKRWTGRWRIIVICGGASLCVESMQLFLPDHYTSASDLMMNCAGAVVGASIARRQAAASS